MKKIRVLIFAFVFSLIVLAIPAVQSSKAIAGFDDKYCQREVVVRLKPGANISAIGARYGLSMLEKSRGGEEYRLALPSNSNVSQKLAEMAADSDLVVAAPNYIYRSPELLQQTVVFIDSTNPPYVSGQSPSPFFSQPQVLNLHLAEAQTYTYGGGVTVAVIDTGIDFRHPLFAGRIRSNGFDFVDRDAVPDDQPGGAGYGHGTFIAGLIRLVAPNAMIMPLRVFDRDGIATGFNIAQAIRYARDHGAKVINMSFGTNQPDPLIQCALNDVYQSVYMVASGGNDNLNALHFPASSNNRTLAVVSTTSGDLKASFSNYNVAVRTSAPGKDLYSAFPANRWAYWSGTSFSTALVTGEAALLLAINPRASRTLLNQTIYNSGVNINPLNPSYAGKLGRRIDFRAAVEMMLGNL
jgi:subtilisin family serine protease